ncbi:response regulator transcription factor [Saccharopolyspora sp. NPDC003762]
MSDRSLSRAGLAELVADRPDAQVVADTHDLASAWAYCRRGRADLVLVDAAVVEQETAPPDAAEGHPWQSAVERVELLSPRESDVFALLGAGLSNRSIARRLGISERTVKSHVAQVLTKLGLESRLQAGLAAQLAEIRGGRRHAKRSTFSSS